MQKIFNSFILGIVALTAGCSTNDYVHSDEVAAYDQFARSTSAHSLLKRLHARAMESYILAGEDVESLVLSSLALLKSLGDVEFAREIGLLTSDERSALRLFIRPEDLGIKPNLPHGNYPRTAGAISAAQKKTDWPSVIVDMKFAAQESIQFEDRDKW